jgi:4-amino-4-deoxy-L-arabinose transferase-like glycosyltransferase
MDWKTIWADLNKAGEDIQKALVSHPDAVFAAYLAVLGIILYSLIQPFPWVNDETTYLLMADAFVKSGDYAIENGFNLSMRPQLRMHATLIKDGRLLPIPPPLYPHLNALQYMFLGIRGLILTNLASYLLTCALIYWVGKRLYGDMVGIASSLIYSLCTYSTVYSVEIWPHSLSVLLTFAPFAAAILSGKPHMMFLAGIASGLGFGIRYTNIIFTGVLIAYLAYKRQWINTLTLTLGAILPITLVFSINHSLWGSPLMTGYGDSVMHGVDSYRLPNMLFGAALIAAIASGAPGRLKNLCWKHAIPILVAFALLTAHFWVEPARTIYSQIFDFSLSVRHHELPAKRALLQASPILALSICGLIKDKKHRLLLIAPPLMQILYYGGVSTGDGSMRLMRYLLESIPFLSIASAVGLKYIITDLNFNLNYKHLHLFNLFLILMAVDYGGETILLITYKVPLLLSLALIICWPPKSRKKGVIISYLLFSVASYGLLVTASYTYVSLETRRTYAQFADTLEAYIPSESLIAYCGYLDQIPAVRIKTQSNVHIAYLNLADSRENIGLLSEYLYAGWGVYILVPPQECTPIEDIMQNIKTKHLTDYGKNYSLENLLEIRE